MASSQLAKVQAPGTGCLGLGLHTVNQPLHACGTKEGIADDAEHDIRNMTRHSVATWTPSLYSLKRPSCIGAACVRCVVPSVSDGMSCLRPAELLESITKNALPEEMQETLLLVAQLFETQPQQAVFPDKALKVDRFPWRLYHANVHSTMCREAYRATCRQASNVAEGVSCCQTAAPGETSEPGL